jgi:hypothetical protein
MKNQEPAGVNILDEWEPEYYQGFTGVCIRWKRKVKNGKDTGHQVGNKREGESLGPLPSTEQE